MAEQRLDKILASTGKWSRREVKMLVRQGRVLVDGFPAASPEQKVDPDTVQLCVNGEEIAYRRYTWLMLNKPAGYLSATSDGRGATVLDLLPQELQRLGLFPVGRLDKDSEGLLLLTNDGAFANALTHPRHAYSKKYRVTIRGKVDDSALLQLREGIDLDGRMTAPCDVTVLTAEENRTVLEFVLHEGRNRQIRRMCEAVELEVIRLKRIAVGSLKLGMLPVGKWRELTDNEVQKLMRSGALQTEDTKK